MKPRDPKETDRKLRAARNWAEEWGEAKNFDDSFLLSIDEAFSRYGRLSDRQEEALDNIVDRFKISVDEWGPG